MDAGGIAFGNTEPQFHPIHRVETDQDRLGGDILADADRAVAQNSIEGGCDGVFRHAFAGEMQGCVGSLKAGAGLVVFLLRDSAVRQKCIRAVHGLLRVIIIRFGFSHRGRLFALVDLKEKGAFFYVCAFRQMDRRNFPIHLWFDVDGFVRFQGSDGFQALVERTRLD